MSSRRGKATSKVLWLTWLLLAGCGERGTLYTGALTPLPLVSTPGALVQVVPQTRRAVVLTPEQGAPVGLPVSEGAHFAAAVPNSELVAVLSGTPKGPLLDVVNAETREVTSLGLPGYFDTIAFSADGRFGVLSYRAIAGTGPLAARNLNEVGLWDIAAGQVTRLQLDTESLAPRAVLFGPTEPSRLLVAVTLERGVAVFDALHPNVAPRRISIRPQGSTGESSVAEAVFSADAHWLFLRATGLDDVIVVELGAEVGAPPSASINFVSGGKGLAGIAAPPLGFEDSVLAVFPASSDAYLLDARGIVDRSKRLVLPQAGNRLQLLRGNHVLFWAEGGSSLTAWDVSDGRTGTLALDGAFSSPLVVPSLDKALLPHAQVRSAAGSGPALSAYTVQEETNRLRLHLSGIQLARALGASTTDTPAQRVFFSGVNGDTVVTMDLRTLQLAEVTLDAAVSRLLYLPRGDFLAADHGGPQGDLTLMPAGANERAQAVRYTSFDLTDELDRPGDAR